MRERNNAGLSEYVSYFLSRKYLAQIVILIVFFILVAAGGGVRIFAYALVPVLAFSKILNWRLLFYVGLALTPVKTVGFINLGFHIQLNHVFLFCAILVALLDKKVGLVLKPGRFDARIFVCLLVLILSSFQSIHLPLDPLVIRGAFRNYPWIKSLSRIAFIIVLVFFAFFIRAYAARKDRLYELRHILVLLSGFYSLIGVVGFVWYMFGIKEIFGVSLLMHHVDDFPRLRVFDWEPLFFGNYLLTITPVIFALVMCKDAVAKKIVILCAAFLNVIAIFLTGSRGVWAGGIAAAGVILWFYFSSRLNEGMSLVSFLRRSFWQFGAIAVLTGLIVAGVELQSGFFSKTVVDPLAGIFDSHSGKFWSTRLRLMVFEMGIGAFLTHPLLGIGYENFSFYTGNVFISTLIRTAVNHPEINNVPLKFLIETGLIGFFIIGCFFFKSVIDLVRLTMRTQDKELRKVLEGLCAAIVGVSVQSFFFSNFLSTYLWVLLGITLAAVNIGEDSETPHISNKFNNNGYKK